MSSGAFTSAGSLRPFNPPPPNRWSRATSERQTRNRPHDPAPDLRRSAARHRDRAALVPDAVVAGDVRARAVEAVRHLPGGARRRRAGRLLRLLALRHGLAPDERGGRPLTPA